MSYKRLSYQKLVLYIYIEKERIATEIIKTQKYAAFDSIYLFTVYLIFAVWCLLTCFQNVTICFSFISTYSMSFFFYLLGANKMVTFWTFHKATTNGSTISIARFTFLEEKNIQLTRQSWKLKYVHCFKRKGDNNF